MHASTHVLLEILAGRVDVGLDARRHHLQALPPKALLQLGGGGEAPGADAAPAPAGRAEGGGRKGGYVWLPWQ